MKLYVVAIFICITLNGCNSYYSFNPFEGRWDDSYEFEIMAGDIIDFNFVNDSFYYSFEEWGCVYMPCTENLLKGDAREYASGKFFYDLNKVTFNGYWHKPSCFNSGNFNITYNYKILNMHSARLILADTSLNKRGIKKELLITRK